MIDANGHPTSVDAALHIFQSNLPVLKKDKDGQVGNQKTKYADLTQANEVVLTRLNALGCIWTCSPKMISLGDQLRFVLSWELKHVPSDTRRTGDFPIQGDNPMKLGSGITYARRYSLLAVTGVIPEDDDDDGQAFEDGVRRAPASGRARAQREPRPARAQGETRRPPGNAPPLPGDEPPDDVPAADERARQAGGTPPPIGEFDPGSITKGQLSRIHALWGDLVKLGQTQFAGDAGRAERITATARLVGDQDLSTTSDLSFADAEILIEKLDGRRAHLERQKGEQPE
jgi:hypothetical protein